MMRQARNFVMRLSINYIVFSILLVLAGVGMKDRQLFGTWVVAMVFTLLTVTLRRFLLALSLSLIIMTAGLFIFVIDAILLALTAALTGLTVDSVWSIASSVLVMSIATVWVEKAFRVIGWRGTGNADGEETTEVLAGRSASWRRRLLMLAILLGGIVFAAAMASQVFLAAGRLTRSMPTITALAALAFAVFVFGIAWLVAQGLALHRRALFAVSVTVLASVLVVTPATVQLFAAPHEVAGAILAAPDGVAFWDLPTGSRIAYWRFPAEGSAKRNPIVFLHGGLGRAVLEPDVDFFSQFAAQSFDVYLYDLIGTGRSARLADIREYSVERHMHDLEAIRETIGADRLNLVAHAEGAEIAIRYLIAHQDRVEHVVFYSPTPMWDDQDFFDRSSRTAARVIPPDPVHSVRQMAALALGLYSPRTAQAYVSQDEMTAWADQVVDESVMVCPGDVTLAPVPERPGYNPYVGLIGDITDDLPSEQRKRLGDVFVPAILLRGECDYVDWNVVEQYWDALPNLSAYTVADAGSMLHLSQPDTVKALILGFLNGSAMPLKPLSERELRDLLRQ